MSYEDYLKAVIEAWKILIPIVKEYSTSEYETAAEKAVLYAKALRDELEKE